MPYEHLKSDAGATSLVSFHGGAGAPNYSQMKHNHSHLPRVTVRFVDDASRDRVAARAEEAGVSISAFLLLCAGEPYPEHGGARERIKNGGKMGTVTCTICGQQKPKNECTPLIGLGRTSDGWECAECDKAASEAKKVVFENDSLSERQV